MADIRLDAEKIVDLVRPILEEIVNDRENGMFDEIVIPMLFLDEKVPGISELTGKRYDLALISLALFVLFICFCLPSFRREFVSTVLLYYFPSLTFLDLAEQLVGPRSGAPTVRKVIQIYKSMKKFADTFNSFANDPDGILLADE